MLTLMPLSGIHSALKRRNSKSYDFTKRDSLSIYSSYSLPSSKASMGKFSTYEDLAPIFQLLEPQGQEAKVKSRRPSISKLIRKHSMSKFSEEKKGDTLCSALDRQLAKIKEQLVSTSDDRVFPCFAKVLLCGHACS